MSNILETTFVHAYTNVQRYKDAMPYILGIDL